ncbi:MAG TPA: amidohydrolase family protein [Longimicrobiales bacterium]|nr:amidohydrolase family protein [Longimicrobiales bacterium]
MNAPTHITRRDAVRTLAAGSLGLATGLATAGLSPGAVEARVSAPRPGRGPTAAEGEILIRGGRVVNADGIVNADVRVVDGTITEVAPGLAPGAGARIVDASGKLVLPGGIDPHTHLQPSFVDDFTTGSMAALAGGVTTVGTFAYAREGESCVAAVDRLDEQVRTDAIADVILHASVWPPSAGVAAQMGALAARGQPSFKIFMTRADFGARIAEVIALLEAARDAGVLVMVHCEDGALLAAAVRRLQAAGRTSLDSYAESRPVVAEVAAAEQATALCEFTGARMHAVHVSSARALEVFTEARAMGLPFHVETRPLYLHLNEDNTKGEDAVLALGQPPLRSAEDTEALWAGLADGRVDILATDHAPWRREQKLDPELTVARVRPGVSNLQFMLPMYFSEGVGRRGLSLERFVATTSTNAARIFGLYPRKGVIRPGAHGDVVVWDPSRTDTVRAADDLSNADYTPFEGWSVTGWPIVVIRRGEVVVEGGQVVGRPGSGALVRRDPGS